MDKLRIVRDSSPTLPVAPVMVQHGIINQRDLLAADRARAVSVEHFLLQLPRERASFGLCLDRSASRRSYHVSKL